MASRFVGLVQQCNRGVLSLLDFPIQFDLILVGSLPPEEQQIWLPNQLAHEP
jgi:hypothetical protein